MGSDSTLDSRCGWDWDAVRVDAMERWSDDRLGFCVSVTPTLLRALYGRAAGGSKRRAVAVRSVTCNAVPCGGAWLPVQNSQPAKASEA
jgi:hypothetical protein